MEIRSSQPDKIRLWIFSELYYPEVTSTGYYLTSIAENLTDEFAVKVLCGQPNYSARKIKAPYHEFRKEVEIFRCLGTTLDKNVIIFRIVNMLTLGASIFFKSLLHLRKGDKILVVTTPPSLPFIAALASMLRGARYVPLIHDNYIEFAIAVGKLRQESLTCNMLNAANKWLYRHAERIIVCGRDMKELVSSRMPDREIPVDFIPNWAELDLVKPLPRSKNRLLKELGLVEKFIFLYAGNLGRANDLESIVHCAEKLLYNRTFHFIFLGEGAKSDWLKNVVSKRQLSNISVLSPRPRDEQNDFLNACDVALVSLVKGMWGVAVPSKTYNILACGKPILGITEPGSEVSRVVSEDQVGWCVNPNDPEALLETILKIYDEREQLSVLGENARRSALKKYSLKTAAEAYHRALADTLSKKLAEN